MSEQAKRSIVELRNELKQLKTELSIATDPADIQRLAQAAGGVKDQLADVNEQVNVFASGSQFEQAGKQLGSVKSALANLDFEKAAARAKSLSTTVSGISFKTATKGLKDLGSTFVNIGKSLLTNPLFLLGAVLALLVKVLLDVIEQAGIMKIVMDQVGKVMAIVQIAIDAVVQALKDLTDWLGLSNNAATDAAESKSKAAEQTAKAYEDGSKKIIQGLDNEIRMAKLNGEETEKLERKKLVILALVAKKRLEADQAQLESARLSGKLSADELKALEDQVNATKLAFDQTLDNLKYFDAQQEKIKQDSADKDRAAATKRKEERLKAEADAAKELEDLRIAAIEDQFQREQEKIKTNLQREIASINANTKLTEETREKLRAAYKAKADAELAKVDEERRKTEEAQEKLFQEAIAILQGTPVKTAMQLLIEQQAAEKKSLEERFKNHKNYADLLAALEKKQADERKAQTDKDEAAERAKLEQQTIDRLYIAANANNATLNQRLAFLEAERDQELAQEDLTERQIFDIKKKYADAAQQLINEEKALKQSSAMQILEAFNAGFGAIASLSDAILANEEANLEEGSAAAEAAAKKRFEVNKAFAVGQALINTALAITSALIGPPGLPFSAIFAAAAAATGAAQVIAIQSQSYKGGGSRPPSPGTPSGPATPSLSLIQPGGVMGPAIPAPTDESGGMAGKPVGGQDMVVRAFVTESDITSSQKKINKYEQLSQL